MEREQSLINCQQAERNLPAAKKQFRRRGWHTKEKGNLLYSMKVNRQSFWYRTNDWRHDKLWRNSEIGSL